MAYPFYGQKCPLGYSILSYVERISDAYDNRYIYYAPNQLCQASVSILDVDRGRSAPKSCPAGNPIYPLLGVKREEVDTGLKVGQLALKLTYDSTTSAPRAPNSPPPADPNPKVLGPLWSSSLHRRLISEGNSLYKAMLVSRGNGRVASFSGPSGPLLPESDINDRLSYISGEWAGFRYVDAAAMAQELYDSQGRMTTMAWASGDKVTLTYSDSSTPSSEAPAPGYLIRAQDNKGRVVAFQYELPAGADPATAGRVNRIIDAAGQALVLSYDPQGNLASITWPDGTSRSFVYENSDFPWALTGIVDEHAKRYATYGYDADGRAISTEHAGGVGRYSVSYDVAPRITLNETYVPGHGAIYRYHDWTAPQGTTLTTPQGASVGMSATTILGKTYVSTQSQPAGSGCGESVSSQQLDANGNLAWREDFNGYRICYANNLARNLEKVRVEGLVTGATCTVVDPGANLPAGARKVTTEWHPDWRLKTQVAEPHRRTTYIYNGQSDPCAPATALLPDNKPIAVLCKQVEQATTDTNGAQGFAASLQAGVPDRVRSWTYNEHGQALTEKDPLNRTTTYEYHSATAFTGTAPDEVGVTKGDLKQVTNAAGHITRYTKYNRAGQVLETVDPNNVVTTHTYDARQRLTSTTVGTRTTTYAYWPTGLLKQVTQPDGSYVQHEYDDAHRLTRVGDNRGNSITYTLDNLGNRTEEKLNDPANVLRRQLNREVDALGRVQKVTGRE